MRSNFYKKGIIVYKTPKNTKVLKYLEKQKTLASNQKNPLKILNDWLLVFLIVEEFTYNLRNPFGE